MNNIKKNILILGLASVLTGCSQSATSVFNKNASYGQNIQYSQVIKSIEKENVNAIFNITYLNSVNTEKWDNNKQNFLIGTYVFDNDEKDFKLTLNGKKEIASYVIDKENPMYKNIAFRNSWATYKVVSFDNIDNSNLTIKYTHPTFDTITATFLRE